MRKHLETMETMSAGPGSANLLEESLHLAILGCGERGRRGDGPFNHATGRGYVKGRKGHYNDAIKKNILDNMVHIILLD